MDESDIEIVSTLMTGNNRVTGTCRNCRATVYVVRTDWDNLLLTASHDEMVKKTKEHECSFRSKPEKAPIEIELRGLH